MKEKKRRKSLDPNTLQLIRQIVGGFLVLVLLAIIVISVWYVSRLPSLTIRSVDVSGGETISHDLVHQLVEAELEGEYLRFIPKRFVLMYPEDSIRSVVSEIDRIKNIEIDTTSRTSIAVSFDEYVPDTLWCTLNLEECVFVDGSGFAFAKAPSLTGGSFLRLEKLGVTPVTNIQAFESGQYLQVKQLVSLLEGNGWFVEKVAVDVAGDAYLTLTKGGELKVALNDAPEQIVENLFTVLSAGEFADIGPGEFEYIDLRFGNKVFVNDLEPDVATTTESDIE